VKINEKTTFHGNVEHDYLGRTYMHIPNDIDIDIRGEPGNRECFLPKRCIHTWTGHSKGVNAIQFFPRSGHLLLSASLDNTVKLWDVYHDREVLRSYMGHNKAVKDVSFNHDGSKFVSAGFDKWLKVWDTGTSPLIYFVRNGEMYADVYTGQASPMCTI
jgi:pre-mRNA-processing factor 17